MEDGAGVKSHSRRSGRGRFTVTVSSHADARLREIAEDEEIAVSEVIRKAIRTYLKIKDQQRTS